jgi:hypothetical protein
MANIASLFYKGDAGMPESQKTKITVRNVTDGTVVAALQTALIALSDCNDAGYSFAEQNLIDAAKPGADANVDEKLVCFLKDTTTGTILSVAIPAPKSTTYELTDQGQRATSATMTAVQGALETATGKTLEPLYGKIRTKG